MISSWRDTPSSITTSLSPAPTPQFNSKPNSESFNALFSLLSGEPVIFTLQKGAGPVSQSA